MQTTFLQIFPFFPGFSHFFPDFPIFSQIFPDFPGRVAHGKYGVFATFGLRKFLTHSFWAPYVKNNFRFARKICFRGTQSGEYDP